MTAHVDPYRIPDDLQAARLAVGLPEEPAIPTDEEVELMKASFGNLPIEEYERPLNLGVDPLQGFDIDFEGLTHKPTSYTLDLLQSVFWMERGLFFDDVEHIAEGNIPFPPFMMVVCKGPIKYGEMPDFTKPPECETKILRINFVKDDDEDQVYGEILHIHAAGVKKEVPTMEITIAISDIEVVNGTLVDSEEAVSG